MESRLATFSRETTVSLDCLPSLSLYFLTYLTPFSLSTLDVGLVKLDVKTKTQNNVEFAVNGTSINDTGRVNASFETKYLFKDWGCTLKEKWTTDNTILTEVSFQDQLIKGSKFLVNANIAPQSGKKTGAVKTSLKGDCFNANADFDFDSLNNGTVIHGSAVLGLASLNVYRNMITTYNFFNLDTKAGSLVPIFLSTPNRVS